MSKYQNSHHPVGTNNLCLDFEILKSSLVSGYQLTVIRETICLRRNFGKPATQRRQTTIYHRNAPQGIIQPFLYKKRTLSKVHREENETEDTENAQCKATFLLKFPKQWAILIELLENDYFLRQKICKLFYFVDYVSNRNKP